MAGASPVGPVRSTPSDSILLFRAARSSRFSTLGSPGGCEIQLSAVTPPSRSG